MKNPYIKTLKPVWENPRYVFVNDEALALTAKKLAREELPAPAWNTAHIHPPMDCGLDLWTSYVGWVNTSNFAFTNFDYPYPKFTIEYPKGTFWKGAFALGASFMRAFEEGIPVFDAEYMANISLEQVAYIFRGIQNHPIPLLTQRWRIFLEVGGILLEKFDGKFGNIFEAGGWRAFNKGKGIVEQLVSNFPSFRDESTHSPGGENLEFHKRAQLLALMHQGRSLNSNGRFPLIADADSIGPPADYDVPRALKILGILVYHPVLKFHIRSRQIILRDSLEEEEVRGQASNAMVQLVSRINKLRADNKVSMVHVDYAVWSMGRQAKIPHHLTPTTAY